ncbi:hypothetical protein PINS_up003270 [Pythium insidiosum]|nr:hypothetical protein PINS_up003270 [Pythium insidiosum]
MFDLFRRANPAPLPLTRSLPRSVSSSDVLDAPTTDEAPPPAFRRCTSAVRPRTLSGWGIVPVLNEIEGRGPSRLRRPPSAKRKPCANCGQLFFVGDDYRPRGLAAFCSLDCRSSHQYNEDLRDLVDARLQRDPTSRHSSSSLSEEDEDVVELEDDELLLAWK